MYFTSRIVSFEVTMNEPCWLVSRQGGKDIPLAITHGFHSFIMDLGRVNVYTIADNDLRTVFLRD